MSPESAHRQAGGTTHKIWVAYDGRPYAGWQRQPVKTTVQGELEKVVARLWGRSINVHGSGRTDTGVHALGQVATFTAHKRFTDLGRMRHALNHNLPPSIRITRAAFAADDFHARFSATGKQYYYRMINRPVMPPHAVGLAWHVPRPLTLQAVDAALKTLLGRHDFSSFTSNPGYKRSSMVRTMQIAERRGSGANLRFIFRADGFLFRMVRNLTGALVQVGLGKITVDEFEKILRARRRAGAPNTAPACGLYLEKVFYE